ncbi:MAG: choline/carnitine O-acyltransferase [Bacillota bacterium]|nr:choline/carnitine O-acyltransferase [Bacillota bacterium]
MYDNQKNLPKLPLPSLSDTCNKLLKWSKPLINDEDYNASLVSVNEFISPEGIGPALENKLIDWYHAQENNDSWLEPFWYDAYLKNRVPLPINSNVSFILDKNESVKGLSQCELAASLAIALFQYSKIINDENLPIDYQGKKPLCMSQYKTLFGTSRIPYLDKDYLFTDVHSKHIVFIIEGHYYSLDVLDDKGEVKDYLTILKSIEWMIGNFSGNTKDDSIGNLTTSNRDTWAKARNHLIEIDQKNKKYIGLIESALIIIVLDQKEYCKNDILFKNMLCGDSNNRWYDKSIQFIITKDAHISLNYEHSGVDGTTISSLDKYLFNEMKNYDNSNDGVEQLLPEELIFEKDDYIISEIEKAKFESQSAFDQLDIEVLFFDNFGKQLLKDNKTSPDSIIQIAIQLAQHKTFGRVFNVYEAASTKQFLHGRTEAMRSVTEESIKFINDKTKKNLFIASKKHIERIIECKNGYGIDRHLFGLNKMHEKYHGNEKFPIIFTTASYKVLSYNKFSTSTSSSTGVILAGYGPVVNDGFGLRYLIYDDELHFVLSSKFENKDNLLRLKDNLENSLDEIASILRG